ncbi:metallophosphoesterase family protein [Rhizobium giardinii]|uniref:metallophosphoesterase family protein n=1 Tax=Rhizobium giardinii TaxID=56731 RepID=UPI0039E00459
MSYTFAIGDIHGCLEPLRKLLARVEARWASGTIVFVGDYIDRGPDSRGVIDLLKAGPARQDWQWVMLKGNHEDMMVCAYAGRYDRDWWLDNGGLETELSYGGRVPMEDLAWADRLPLMHLDAHRLFVHAGVNPDVALDQQSPQDLLWLRPESSAYYWGKHLCHGHTPSRANPRTIGNRTNIDSGCVFGGKLTCAVFDDDVEGGPVEFIKAGW